MARAPRTTPPARPRRKAGGEADLRDQARALSGLALETLAAILRGDGGDTAKIAAAREVLDRAHGKTKADEKAVAPKALTVVIRRFGEDGGTEPDTVGSAHSFDSEDAP